MSASILYRSALVALFFFVSACSDLLDGPTETDIKNQLAFQMPAGVEVDSVEILVSENIGSEVDPRYRNRSKATIKLLEDRVDVVDTYGDKYIVKTVLEEETQFNLTLISTATLANEKWQVTFDRMEGGQYTGAPLSQFFEGTFAYEGSSEAEKIIADYEAKLKAEAEAAEARKEQLRQEAVARAAQEEVERAARIKAFREFLAGTWLSKAPVFRNKQPYITRNNETAGLEVSFPEGDEAKGRARVTLFVTEDITDKVTVDANFEVADNGQAVVIFLNTRTTHSRLKWTFRENWTFYSNGVMATRSGREEWAVEMSKGGAALEEKRAEEQRLENRAAAIAALGAKHRAFSGDRRLRDIGLKNNSYGPVFVDAEKAQKGDVWGNNEQGYGENSSVISTAIHAGVLKEGESGVLKVTHGRLTNRYNIKGLLKNGIQSQNFSRSSVYQIELIEKLAVD